MVLGVSYPVVAKQNKGTKTTYVLTNTWYRSYNSYEGTRELHGMSALLRVRLLSLVVISIYVCKRISHAIPVLYVVATRTTAILQFSYMYQTEITV